MVAGITQGSSWVTILDLVTAEAAFLCEPCCSEICTRRLIFLQQHKIYSQAHTLTSTVGIHITSCIIKGLEKDHTCPFCAC